MYQNGEDQKTFNNYSKYNGESFIVPTSGITVKELELKKEYRNSNLKVIKSISIKDKEDFRKINYYQENDYFLLDYKPEKNELPGGNAKQFDWSLLSDLNINKPWFLSGGVNKSNINKIKNYVNPDGIDLSSGVEEAPGIKNKKMINNLFKKYYVK